MSCFLCAYGRRRVPKTPDTPASTVPLPFDLGTCRRCSVHACSRHGARVGQFICAICEGADVVEHVIAPDPAAATRTTSGAITRARLVGESAPEPVGALVGEALRRISEDGGARPGLTERLELSLPGAGSPNLVFNLSESIRELAGERFDVSTELSEPPERGMSVDAVGDVVRELFLGREIVVTEAAVPIVTGALVIAARVAHEPDESTEDTVRLAPWEMTDPLLLDPVMWMVSTAVRQATMSTGAVTA